MTSRTGLLWLNSPVRAEEFAEILWILNPLAFADDQTLSVHNLVFFEINLGIVVEVEHFLEGTKVLLRTTVTVETPSHGVALGMMNLLHLVHFAVTADTGNPAIQVCGVIKVYVVGSLVNPNPLDGLTFNWLPVGIHDRAMEFINTHRITETGQFGRTLLHVLVTIPAGIGRRDVGMPGMLNKTVTVTTIHPQLIHVEIVIVVNGLSGLVADSLGLGSSVIGDSSNNAGTKCSKTNRNFQRQ